MSISKRTVWRIAFGISLFANVILVWRELLHINPGRVGVLTKDLQVHAFGKGSPILFTLPRGLTVKDGTARLPPTQLASPYRFTIVFASDYPGVVDYSTPADALNHAEEIYSIDERM
jgi:hypothetical protein